MYNEALRNEKQDPLHSPHGPFYFDYVDSDHASAMAFADGGFSFIGVTIPMVGLTWEICARLRGSTALCQLLALESHRPEIVDGFQVVLFRTQLGFIVCHEYAHHVWGHVSEAASAFWIDEIDDSPVASGTASGGFEQQIRESEADGYAAYLTLASLLDSPERSHSLSLLGATELSADRQDQLLFACFVAATGGFLFARPPQALDAVRIRTYSHPPQAARMNFLMHRAQGWCEQFRPSLKEWMTLLRFQTLMNEVALATWGLNGGQDWSAQTAFLRTTAGGEYFKAIDAGLKARAAASTGESGKAD